MNELGDNLYQSLRYLHEMGTQREKLDFANDHLIPLILDDEEDVEMRTHNHIKYEWGHLNPSRFKPQKVKVVERLGTYTAQVSATYDTHAPLLDGSGVMEVGVVMQGRVSVEENGLENKRAKIVTGKKDD